MRLVSGWRLALRLAGREARRAPGRSLLVLTLVTLPVVAVVAADVAQATSSVSPVEGLDRRIGTSQALVRTIPGAGRVMQTADPDSGGFATAGGGAPGPSLDAVERALGGPRPAVELRTRQVPIRTHLGLLRVDATGLDLRSPLAHGLYRLTSRRLPTGPHEVAMNAAMAAKGYAVGDTLTESDGTRATVVGTIESTRNRTLPLLVGDTSWLPAAPPDAPRAWLIGGAPVSWAQVRSVNALGATVVSREVIEHPPSPDQLPPQLRELTQNSRATTYAVLALIGVMALIEVVLLAGPAFAVGARRQARSLALIAANGGTPRQSRRMILGTAIVLGAIGSVAGVVLGIAVAWALLPLLQSTSDTYFGPFQVRWNHVLAIAAFGLVSALLAAVVPAWIASRQDVVAVLAGRRGDRPASRRSPFVGLALLGAGVGVATLGARRGSGELLIAGAAVLSVFGMIFLVPVAVVAVARLGRRFPLPLRYAVRDAARHRTRTVPAVAAVAATVAGVVALSIGNASSQAHGRAQYTPQLPDGMGLATDYAGHPRFATDAATLLRTAHAHPQVIRGVPSSSSAAQVATVVGRARHLLVNVSPTFAADELVADSMPPVLPARLNAGQRAAADAVLARGGVVLFSQQPDALHRATFVVTRHPAGQPMTRSRESVPAYVAVTGGASDPALMVLSTQAARRLSLPNVPVGVVFDAHRLPSERLAGLEQALDALSPQGANVYVERGYRVPNAEKVVLWILYGLAAVLMLGGTLTATFLALSDARPDLATMSAVGASPRMRRGVAASYALSIGVVGAVLGAMVGFVPGVAVSYPLTRDYSGSGPSHYLAIPWPEIVALVVALPILTALVVGLAARSRLPLVARLE